MSYYNRYPQIQGNAWYDPHSKSPTWGSGLAQMFQQLTQAEEMKKDRTQQEELMELRRKADERAQRKEDVDAYAEAFPTPKPPTVAEKNYQDKQTLIKRRSEWAVAHPNMFPTPEDSRLYSLTGKIESQPIKLQQHEIDFGINLGYENPETWTDSLNKTIRAELIETQTRVESGKGLTPGQSRNVVSSQIQSGISGIKSELNAVREAGVFIDKELNEIEYNDLQKKIRALREAQTELTRLLGKKTWTEEELKRIEYLVDIQAIIDDRDMITPDNK